ncbi:MAG TPA: PQQ-binding-like beta-propeller repeat protein [Roseimicrobium sp.]|nr:PQQ-binding-like beta-propeller repeat protein [Roseimicrobium sp.]
MSLRSTLALSFSIGLSASQVMAVTADWSQFRGPGGSGIAAGSKPPTAWSDSQNVRWKAQLPGPGTSSPIAVGDKLFVTCWSGYGASPSAARTAGLTRHLVCVQRSSGKILWSKAVQGEAQADSYDGFMQEHGYASHTPVTDGERVYVYFGRGGALAFDLDGKQLWKVDLGQSSNGKNWGSASSPVLYKDYVIVNASEESHAIYALDKKTGKQVWKAEGGGLEYVFGTPVMVTAEGRSDLVIALPNELWGMNPDTGKLRWYAETGLPGNIAPSVVAGDGVVFAFGGFPRTATVAVKTGGKGDVTKTHLLWSNNNSTYIPTPVLHEGRLYFASDAGFATCLDAKTGTLVYKERLPGASATGRGGKPFYASMVLANGNVYAVSRRNGTFLFEAKPQFKLVGQNTLSSDDSQFNATPAVVGNQMFLRSDRYLYCLATGAGE